MDEKLLKEAMAKEIKKGTLVAITNCCKAPMNVKSFKLFKCDVCGSKQADNTIFFFSPDKYKEFLKENGN
jgi:hypothetical protein